MTKTEKELQRLSEAIVASVERIAGNESEIEDVSDYAEKVETVVEKLRERVADLQTQVAVLQGSQADLVKRWDESDRRRWGVWGYDRRRTGLPCKSDLALPQTIARAVKCR